MERNLVCNECGGMMKIGHVPDHTYGGIVKLFWVEGKPVKSFWTGLKVDDKKWYYISAYRCERCGLLKFYAESESAIKK